jgi:hypothetical protein
MHAKLNYLLDRCNVNSESKQLKIKARDWELDCQFVVPRGFSNQEQPLSRVHGTKTSRTLVDSDAAHCDVPRCSRQVVVCEPVQQVLRTFCATTDYQRQALYTFDVRAPDQLTLVYCQQQPSTAGTVVHRVAAATWERSRAQWPRARHLTATLLQGPALW